MDELTAGSGGRAPSLLHEIRDDEVRLLLRIVDVREVTDAVRPSARPSGIAAGIDSGCATSRRDFIVNSDLSTGGTRRACTPRRRRRRAGHLRAAAPPPQSSRRHDGLEAGRPRRCEAVLDEGPRRRHSRRAEHLRPRGATSGFTRRRRSPRQGPAAVGPSRGCGAAAIQDEPTATSAMVP